MKSCLRRWPRVTTSTPLGAWRSEACVNFKKRRIICPLYKREGPIGTQGCESIFVQPSFSHAMYILKGIAEGSPSARSSSYGNAIRSNRKTRSSKFVQSNRRSNRRKSIRSATMVCVLEFRWQKFSQKTVTDCLHDAGIRVFRDDGEKIGSDLLQAIRNSKKKRRFQRIGAFKSSFRRQRAWSASVHGPAQPSSFLSP